MKEEKIYIIILNYNGWKDTIECLESVLKLNYLNYQIVVCDNNSTDGSFEKMIEWAQGKRCIEKTLYKDIVYPLEKKPISYAILNKNLEKRTEKVLFLQTGKNLGFAGGNNKGVYYALKQNDFSYIWFINNDTIVQKDSLCILEKYIKKNPKLGICGSKLLYYDNPKNIQGLAGYYNPILGIGRHICKECELNNMSYVIGASMLVRKAFIEKIGLMNEFYFLYYEELDWVKRAENIFDIGICLDSIVYHKEGSSIGTKSSFSEYYLLRNKLVFTWIYYKKYIFFVFVRMLMNIFHPYHKRPYKRCQMLKKVIKDAYKLLKDKGK